MKIIIRLGTLMGLLLVTFVSTKAADPACEAQPINENGTSITSPAPNAVLTSPFTMRGEYFSPFEANVPTRILDARGEELLAPVITALGNEGLQPYEESISFNVSEPTPACIAVYFEDIEEGGLTPLAQIPVTLSSSPALPPTGAAEGGVNVLLILVPFLLASGFVLRRSLNRRSA